MSLKLLLGISVIVAAVLHRIYKYVEKQFGDKLSLCTSAVKLDGKVVIVTGASAGIGLETERDLARRGAKVYLAVRNENKGQTVADDIVASTGNHSVHVLVLDLSSFKSVVDFVKEFQSKENRLDILVNNAGVSFLPNRTVTEDGFEYVFQANYLGHFLLTLLLLDLMKGSTPSRIVNVSSVLHRLSEIKFNDINGERRYDVFETYGQSKLAQILFTKTLAKRLEGTGVSTFVVHPGSVVTRTASHGPLPQFTWYQGLLYYTGSILMRHFGKTVVQGAQTSIYCAVSEELEPLTGRYFVDCEEAEASKHGRDDVKADKLWEYSMDMVEPYLKVK
jgi:NAD(P)-dependent dehydrogenase (short-subunit alcohol dehydrogenase family)